MKWTTFLKMVCCAWAVMCRAEPVQIQPVDPITEARRQQWYAAAVESHCVTGSIVIRVPNVGFELIYGTAMQVMDGNYVLLRDKDGRSVALGLPDTSGVVDGDFLAVWAVRRKVAYRFQTVAGSARQVPRYDCVRDMKLLSWDDFLAWRHIPSIAELCPPPPTPQALVLERPAKSDPPGPVGMSPHAVMRLRQVRRMQGGDLSR